MEYARKLPHFDHEGATFFVTFRLENSIPADIARQLKTERAREIEDVKKSKIADKPQKIIDIEEKYFLQYDDLLDHPTFGDRFLDEPQCAEIIIDILNEYDDKFYQLDAYCIMPNHVHLLIDTSLQLDPDGFVPKDYQYLKDIMRRIKSKSAVYINRSRRRNGQLWEEESYDRYIRNMAHFQYVENYIVQNPIKAGLGTSAKPYPYVFVRQR
jgi:putative transposase